MHFRRGRCAARLLTLLLLQLALGPSPVATVRPERVEGRTRSATLRPRNAERARLTHELDRSLAGLEEPEAESSESKSHRMAIQETLRRLEEQRRALAGLLDDRRPFQQKQDEYLAVAEHMHRAASLLKDQLDQQVGASRPGELESFTVDVVGNKVSSIRAAIRLEREEALRSTIAEMDFELRAFYVAWGDARGETLAEQRGWIVRPGAYDKAKFLATGQGLAPLALTPPPAPRAGVEEGASAGAPLWGENRRPSFPVTPEEVIVYYKSAGESLRSNVKNSMWANLPLELKEAIILSGLSDRQGGAVLLTTNRDFHALAKFPQQEPAPVTYDISVTHPVGERVLEQIRRGESVEIPAQRSRAKRVFIKPHHVEIVHSAPSEDVIRIVVPEDRGQQAWLLVDAMGLLPVQMTRVRIGSVGLNGMRPGDYRRVAWDELVELMTTFGMDSDTVQRMSAQHRDAVQEETEDRHIVMALLRDDRFVRDIFRSVFGRPDLGLQDLVARDIQHIGEGGFKRVYQVLLRVIPGAAQRHDQEPVDFLAVVKVVKPAVKRSDSGYLYDERYANTITEVIQRIRQKFLFLHPPSTSYYFPQDRQGRRRIVSAEGLVPPTNAALDEPTRDRLMIRTYLMLYLASDGTVFVADPKRPNVILRRRGRGRYDGTIIDLDNLIYGVVNDSDLVFHLLHYGFRAGDIIPVLMETLGTARAQRIVASALFMASYLLTNDETQELREADATYQNNSHPRYDQSLKIPATIPITVNGIEQPVPEDATLAEVLDDRYVDPFTMTVRVNGQAIISHETRQLSPREKRRLVEIPLSAGSRVEFMPLGASATPPVTASAVRARLADPARQPLVEALEQAGLHARLRNLKRDLATIGQRMALSARQEDARLSSFKRALNRVIQDVGQYLNAPLTADLPEALSAERIDTMYRTAQRVDLPPWTDIREQLLDQLHTLCEGAGIIVREAQAIADRLTVPPAAQGSVTSQGALTRISEDEEEPQEGTHTAGLEEPRPARQSAQPVPAAPGTEPLAPLALTPPPARRAGVEEGTRRNAPSPLLAEARRLLKQPAFQNEEFSRPRVRARVTAVARRSPLALQTMVEDLRSAHEIFTRWNRPWWAPQEWDREAARAQETEWQQALRQFVIPHLGAILSVPERDVVPSGEGSQKIVFRVGDRFIVRISKSPREAVRSLHQRLQGMSEADVADWMRDPRWVPRIIDVPGQPMDLVEPAVPLDQVFGALDAAAGADAGVRRAVASLKGRMRSAVKHHPFMVGQGFEFDDDELDALVTDMGLAARRDVRGKPRLYVVPLDLDLEAFSSSEGIQRFRKSLGRAHARTFSFDPAVLARYVPAVRRLNPDSQEPATASRQLAAQPFPAFGAGLEEDTQEIQKFLKDYQTVPAVPGASLERYAAETADALCTAWCRQHTSRSRLARGAIHQREHRPNLEPAVALAPLWLRNIDRLESYIETGVAGFRARLVPYGISVGDYRLILRSEPIENVSRPQQLSVRSGHVPPSDAAQTLAFGVGDDMSVFPRGVPVLAANFFTAEIRDRDDPRPAYDARLREEFPELAIAHEAAHWFFIPTERALGLLDVGLRAPQVAREAVQALARGIPHPIAGTLQLLLPHLEERQGWQLDDAIDEYFEVLPHALQNAVSPAAERAALLDLFVERTLREPDFVRLARLLAVAQAEQMTLLGGRSLNDWAAAGRQWARDDASFFNELVAAYEQAYRQLIGAVGTRRARVEPSVSEAAGTAGRIEVVRDGRILDEFLSPDGTHVVTTGDHSLNVWDSRQGILRHTFTLRTRGMDDVAFAPDGRTVACTMHNGNLQAWALPSGDPLYTVTRYRQGGEMLRTMAFSPDGTVFATGGLNGLLAVWDARTGQLRRAWQGHQGPITALVFSRQGTRLASGEEGPQFRLGAAGKVKIWDISATSPTPVEFVGHTDMITDLAFSEDGKWSASASLDGTAKIWDVSQGRLRHNLHVGVGVALVLFSPDGREVVTASRAQLAPWRHAKFTVWDVEAGTASRSVDVPAAVPVDLRFVNDDVIVTYAARLDEDRGGGERAIIMRASLSSLLERYGALPPISVDTKTMQILLNPDDPNGDDVGTILDTLTSHGVGATQMQVRQSDNPAAPLRLTWSRLDTVSPAEIRQAVSASLHSGSAYDAVVRIESSEASAPSAMVYLDEVSPARRAGLEETVVYVQDDADHVEFVADFLRPLGCRVVAGAPADLVRAGQVPQVAILDSAKASHSVKALRALWPQLRVLILSADLTFTGESARAWGADALFLKPLDREALIQQVAALLGREAPAPVRASPEAFDSGLEETRTLAVGT